MCPQSQACLQVRGGSLLKSYLVRFEFQGVNLVLVSGGLKFDEPRHFVCSRDDISQDVLEKIALLDVQGTKLQIPNIGKKVKPETYYIEMTHEDFEALKERVKDE